MAKTYYTTCDKCGSDTDVTTGMVFGERFDLCRADITKALLACGVDKASAGIVAAEYTGPKPRAKRSTVDAEPVE